MSLLPFATKPEVEEKKPVHHRRHHRHVTHHKKEPLISIEMVSKTYADDPLDFKTLVLKNIYVQIYEGEFVAIFGPSGSGKSTLLNLIAGLEKPTAGRVLVRRRDLSKFDNEELAQFHRSKMGFVFQSFNLIKSLNVWENVALPQTAQGIPIAERKVKAMRLLKLLHVDQYANRQPNELSGGEQQRVAIARALINDPYFLIVDEPTGNLDSKSADAVMEILKEVNEEAKHTIVLVTHNPAQLQYASRVIYIQDGQIVIEENRGNNGSESASPFTTTAATTFKDDPTINYKLVDTKAKPKVTEAAKPESTEAKEEAPKPAAPTVQPVVESLSKPVVNDVIHPVLPTLPAATQSASPEQVPQPQPPTPEPALAPAPTTPAHEDEPVIPIVPKTQPEAAPEPEKAPLEMPNTDTIKTVYIKGDNE